VLRFPNNKTLEIDCILFASIVVASFPSRLPEETECCSSSTGDEGNVPSQEIRLAGCGIGAGKLLANGAEARDDRFGRKYAFQIGLSSRTRINDGRISGKVDGKSDFRELSFSNCLNQRIPRGLTISSQNRELHLATFEKFQSD
jgi:hypothetical protein